MAVTVLSVAATVHSTAEATTEAIAVHLTAAVATVHSEEAAHPVHSEVVVLTAMAEARAVAAASVAEDNMEYKKKKPHLELVKLDVKFISSSNQPQMRLHSFSFPNHSKRYHHSATAYLDYKSASPAKQHDTTHYNLN